MMFKCYIAFKQCDKPGRRQEFFPLIVFLVFFINCAEVYSQEPETTAGAAGVEQTAEAPADIPPLAELFNVLDAPRDYLSEKIVSYSKGIDEFFGDERYFQENNKSVIQLELNETINTGGNRDFLFEGKAKLDLPSAQRRFQLVLESNPEQKTAGETKKDQVAPKGTAKPDQYAASLRFEKAEEDRWHYSADSGAQFQFPLDPFVRTRGSYSLPIADWRLKLAESVFWFGTIGLGETTQFDMERVIKEPLLFRATTTATCFENTQKCDLRQDLSMFHTLNNRAALLYQASVIGVDKPLLQETEYILLMRYRYRWHREWVFFEISPQLHFPKTDDFKLNALLNLRMEIIFGGTQ